MKKIKVIFAVMLIGLSCSSLFAQRGESGLGIRGGFNFSKFGRDLDKHDNDIKLGYHAGLYAKLALGEVFALQPEVLYSTKGSNTSTDLFNGNGFFNPDSEGSFAEEETSLHYIDVPLMLRLNFGAFHIMGGPQVSFLMRANRELSNGTAPDVKYDIKDNVNDTDYAIVAGIGLESRDGFNIGIRGSYGLEPVFKNMPDNRTNRNMLAMLTFGYTFPMMR